MSLPIAGKMNEVRNHVRAVLTLRKRFLGHLDMTIQI